MIISVIASASVRQTKWIAYLWNEDFRNRFFLNQRELYNIII
jgi:hypothetical protein